MARDYNAAITALNSLQSNFSILDAIRKSGMERNKDAMPEMIQWCHRVGYEPSDFDALNPVHIAGTKGKGSTSSFISSILAQYLPSRSSIHAERIPSSVGLYTSPHLRSVRERIQINNQPISESQFARYFFEVWDRFETSAAHNGHVDPKATETKPAYFRFLTLVALHCFMQEKVGTAVIECGVGGEYDSTNLLVNPSVTGVTSLGIDHILVLGNTIESIAWHKAGIFKKDVPAFTVPQPETAFSTLKTRAEERSTDLQLVEPYPVLDNVQLGLHGDFQKTNASLAIAISAAHLHRLGFTGVPHPFTSQSQLPTEFLTGLQTVKLGGRCETRTDLVKSSLTWYLDGGHTLESIEMAGKWFAKSIETQKATLPENAFRVLIFNQQTRDAVSLARKLHNTLASAMGNARPFQHAIFCSNTTYKDAGYKADLVSINTNKDDVDTLKVQKQLAGIWQEIDQDASVNIFGTVEEAVAQARVLAGDRQTEVLVTGSLHLVGGLIEVLENEKESTESGRL